MMIKNPTAIIKNMFEKTLIDPRLCKVISFCTFTALINSGVLIPRIRCPQLISSPKQTMKNAISSTLGNNWIHVTFVLDRFNT